MGEAKKVNKKCSPKYSHLMAQWRIVSPSFLLKQLESIDSRSGLILPRRKIKRRQRKIILCPWKAAKKRGFAPSLLRTPSNCKPWNETYRRKHICNLPVDAATCKGVFPSLFFIHINTEESNSESLQSNFSTSLLYQSLITRTRCRTFSSGAMETAKCNAVSPDVLILAEMALIWCSSYISTTFFHWPVMVFLYNLMASESSSLSVSPIFFPSTLFSHLFMR